jgi:hypothetical protein
MENCFVARGAPPFGRAARFGAGGAIEATTARAFAESGARSLEHDPEKWEPVFGKDHAQTRI